MKMINKKQLSKLVNKSQGDVAGRFDDLEDTAQIVIFETPNEVGVYKATTNSPEAEVVELRTRTSGNTVPKKIASMSKGAFYRNNMLVALCSQEMKKDRPINYYGI